MLGKWVVGCFFLRQFCDLSIDNKLAELNGKAIIGG